MKHSLTIRMLKVGLMALIPAFLWLGVAFLITMNQETSSEQMAVDAVILAFWSVLFLHCLLFLKQWAFSSRWYLSVILWLIIGVIAYSFAREIGQLIYNLAETQFCYENLTHTLKTYALNGGIGFFIAVFPVAYIFQIDRIKENKFFRQWFVDGKGAGGDYAGVRSFDKKEIKHLNWLSKEGFRTKSILLGRNLWQDDPGMRLIGDRENSHHLVCASARSGKSVSFLYNNLLMVDTPAIVFDLRGELSKQTFYRRSSKNWLNQWGLKGKAIKHFENGRCFVFDPFHETDLPSWNYNLLSEIDIESPRVREMLSAISEGCVLPEKGENVHFQEIAQFVIEGVIAFVLGNVSKQNQNLVYITELLNGFDNEIGVARIERFNELLVKMLMDTESAGGLPAEAAIRLQGMGDKEKGSVLSTVARSLKWISDPSMKKHLVGDNSFRFSEIGSNGFIDTLYVVLPENMMSEAGQMRWFRTITNLGMALLRSRAVVKSDTLFILDEFARLQNIKSISDGISTLMGDKIKLIMAIQNLGQLIHNYPKRWNSFIANSTLEFFGVHDLETANYISSLLGNRIEKVKNNGKDFEKKLPLMTAQEVMTYLAKNRNRMLVFPVDGLPLRLERVGYKRVRELNPITGLIGHYEF
ncbi:MAG: type IV secretory system conjugative DNA transfer family protein [Cytophagales bacterium]|nr:type IV secretory system conjugative DNA transfer family protein [Cytophagales bacterium]